MRNLRVNGMNCANCVRHVTEAIQKVPGVSNASVSLEGRRASVQWKAGAPENVAAVVEAVKDAGYEAEEAGEDDDTCSGTHDDWQIGLWLGVAVTVFLMAGEWIFRIGEETWFEWASFALAGCVQAFSGARFYRGAWNQIKVGNSNMDTLVALGSTTAFSYSAWALFSGAGGHLYFMEASAIITLISLGHWLEARVSTKATGTLKALLNLAPKTARKLISSNGESGESDVPISSLARGDRVALRPGDIVPVDGVVLEGESAIDESMLTGESIPVEKKAGADVLAGTALVNGRLVMRVTVTGQETALAHVIAAVQRAQSSRADIQRIGDQVSAVFVPIVVVIAIVAGLAWGLAPAWAGHVHDVLSPIFWHISAPAGTAAGFIIAAAVLIIACPCAMGLATPAAIMAGANAAARRGILIRDGVALEKAGKIMAVVFDKTGTITEGRPAVAQTWQNPDFAGGDARPLAAALARHSTHPISAAIAGISNQDVALRDWEEIGGAGLSATASGAGLPSCIVRLGSLRWLKDNEADVGPGGAFIEEWRGQGATVIGLTSGKNLLALFAVRDAVKRNAAGVVRQLQAEGRKVYLVTGDHPQTAASIARQAGIAEDHVFAEVRPEQKAEFVGKLQQRGERVAFVGDGINDAPALTRADLGVAVSRASDIAREAADVILLKSDIEAVPEALSLARTTLKIIKQNLFWAFFYNALGVPLAALGFVSPIFSAAAMGASDLIVIGNAMRLLRWRSPAPTGN